MAVQGEMLPLHPLNRGFTWQDRPLAGLRLLTPEQVALYNSDGYCILRKALSPETVARLLAEIDPLEAKLSGYVIALDGGGAIAYEADNMTFTQDLVRASPAVGALCRAPVIMGLTRDLLGCETRLYWNQAVYKKPEKGRVFPWHQDNGYTYVEPQDYLTCWIALSEATLDNGCPWVFPCRHRRGTLAHGMGDNGVEILGLGNETGALAVPLAAGDMVLFSSLTPHRTGANVGAGVRKALILQFAREGACRVMPDGSLVPQDDPVRNMRIP